VYVDLETSGFQKNCDILQIAAKCGKHLFNIYINPIHEISAAATAVHGLRKCEAELMLYGKKVSSVPLRAAIGNLLQWLNSLMKKCYITAHNLNFDGPRLFDAILFCSLNDDFSNVVEGFIDTLQVIRKETERKGKTKCTLTELANWLNISCVNAHNAIQDVSMLEEIIKNISKL